MDVRVYYQKIREAEAKIGEEFPIIVSRETPDGGRDGIKTEVSKHIAAKLIVEGQARPATAEEAKAFREEQAAARRMAEQVAASSKVQLTVLSAADFETLKGKAGNTKG